MGASECAYWLFRFVQARQVQSVSPREYYGTQQVKLTRTPPLRDVGLEPDAKLGAINEESGPGDCRRIGLTLEV